MPKRQTITIGPEDRFIADTHFGHSSIINSCARPFDTVAEMDRSMIESWNAVVAPTTILWHFGDFANWRLPVDRLRWIFDQLNGVKRLVVGNHDSEDVCALPWESVDHGVVHLKDPVSGLKVAASHHPQREWDGWWNGGLHLHGHTHSRLPSSRRSLDVGVDNIGFVPQSFEQLRARMLLLPELDFTGVPTVEFVPERDRD